MNRLQPGRKWRRSLPKFADVDEEAVGALCPKNIIDVHVGPGGLIELDAEARAPAGLEGLELVGIQAGEGLGVSEDDGAEEAVGGEREAIFGFEVNHFVAAEPALDIASAGTGIGIPVGGGEVEVGWLAAQDKPVIIPKRQDIARTIREIKILPHIDDG